MTQRVELVGDVPADGMTQRVVLERTQGEHKGTHQILGRAALLCLGGRPLPEYLLDIETDVLPPVKFASLIKVTPRTILYREAFPKPVGRLGQQMDSFHPEQR